MTTRLGREQQSRDWPYPGDLAGSLEKGRPESEIIPVCRPIGS
jgi:hypothetical protein